MSAVPFRGYEKGKSRTAFETASGGFFDFASPRAEDVNLADVAASLSKTCRFSGHIRRFYSVAEHALLVRDLVVRMGHPELALAALHHDSEEAYLGDVITPLKARLGDAFQAVRAPLDAAVGGAFGIDPALFHHPVIVEADLRALRAEAHELKPSSGYGYGLDHVPVDLPLGLSIEGLSHEEAEGRFLAAHAREVELEEERQAEEELAARAEAGLPPLPETVRMYGEGALAEVECIYGVPVVPDVRVSVGLALDGRLIAEAVVRSLGRPEDLCDFVPTRVDASGHPIEGFGVKPRVYCVGERQEAGVGVEPREPLHAFDATGYPWTAVRPPCGGLPFDEYLQALRRSS